MQNFIFLILFSLSAGAENCLQKQGAIDIGSGSTKAIVAEVDVCKKIIVKIVFEDNQPVAFSEVHEKSPDRKIPEAFVQQQLPVFRELAARMKKEGAISISALATSVFRKAENGAAVAALIAANIGGTTEIITQEQEAQLGYWSAAAVRPPKKGEDLIVWDIGGGSMQITRRLKNKFVIYQGDYAAVNFKNRVIQQIHKKDPQVQTSPNPLGNNWPAAMQMAAVHARQSVPPTFHKNTANVIWLGIGGVLYNSVREQSGNPKNYNLKLVKQSLEQRSKLNDQQLGGPYASTDVTNLALVAGFMEALQIKDIEPVKVSLAQGWLLYRLNKK